MAEVPEHLIPSDGLANVSVRIKEMRPFPGGAEFTIEFFFFETKADPELVIGKLVIPVGSRRDKPMADLFARAHEAANPILRQLLYVNDKCRQAYEREVALFDQQSSTQKSS